jgi:hypothetical protein
MNHGPSPLGAFVFLLIGVLIQAVLERFLYPVLSARHERAKFMGRATADPHRIFLVLRIVNFIVLPALGLFAGSSLVNH